MQRYGVMVTMQVHYPRMPAPKLHNKAFCLNSHIPSWPCRFQVQPRGLVTAVKACSAVTRTQQLISPVQLCQDVVTNQD